jgi:hypothetical protein
LELVDGFDAVGELVILRLLLLLLLLDLLLGPLLVQVALLAGYHHGPSLYLLLPLLPEHYRAGGLLALFVDLEGIGSETVAV